MRRMARCGYRGCSGGDVSATTAGVSGASTPRHRSRVRRSDRSNLLCDAASRPRCARWPLGAGGRKYFNAKGGAKTADGKTHQLRSSCATTRTTGPRPRTAPASSSTPRSTFATRGAVNADKIVPCSARAGIAYFNPTPQVPARSRVRRRTRTSSAACSACSRARPAVGQPGNKNIAVVAQGAGTAIVRLTKASPTANGPRPPWWRSRRPTRTGAGRWQASSADVIMSVADKYGPRLSSTPARRPASDARHQRDRHRRRRPRRRHRRRAARSSGRSGPGTSRRARQGVGRLPGGNEEVLPKTLQEPSSQSMSMWSNWGRGHQDHRQRPTAANFIAAADAMTSIPTLGGTSAGHSFRSRSGLYPRQLRHLLGRISRSRPLRWSTPRVRRTCRCRDRLTQDRTRPTHRPPPSGGGRFVSAANDYSRARSSCFLILPVMVFGRSSTNTTWLGFL